MGDYTLASAIVVLCIAYFPLVSAGILTHLNAAPQHISSNQATGAHKSDRIAGIKFEDRWNAVANNQAEPARQRVERIPFACEAAFSRLVNAGNFAVRCVADIEAVGAGRTTT
jgi:hypothetical protein